MNDLQLSIIGNLANGIIKDNRNAILSRWLAKARLEIADKNIDFAVLNKGFESLVNDFILYLSIGDLKSYYSGNSLIAQSIAHNDITFDQFISAFHIFEDSYLPLLLKLPKRELLQYINALDRLHHKTISVISETYFDIKDSIITSLTKLIELRDNETAEHLDRTRKYCSLLAGKLNYPREFITEIYEASLLHDIGKVGIRDSILLKPGKLTTEEFEEVKTHTTIGAQTIDKIIGSQKNRKDYLFMARDIALYHHEKYDGSGYPEGLIAEQIPVAARILSVVDAYDAIVSERPYKPALPHAEAVRRITLDSGRHFDPKIVQAFLNIHIQFQNYSGTEFALM